MKAEELRQLVGYENDEYSLTVDTESGEFRKKGYDIVGITKNIAKKELKIVIGAIA